MTDLIRRLEEAKEGNGDLDIAFWLRVVPGSTYKKTGYTHIASGEYCAIDETRDATGRLVIVPRYTTNLQDAVSAVPEGYSLVLHGPWQDGKPDGWKAQVAPSVREAWKDDVTGATASLALCIAILRAMEAKNE